MVAMLVMHPRSLQAGHNSSTSAAALPRRGSAWVRTYTLQWDDSSVLIYRLGKCVDRALTIAKYTFVINSEARD